MAHLPQLLERLPPLYGEGRLVGELMASPALALEIADEDLLEIRRAHWFDDALDLVELERLAALLDIRREDWLDEVAELRAWVRGLVEAIAEHGAVTRAALRAFVDTYVEVYLRNIRRPRLLATAEDHRLPWTDDAELAGVDPATARRSAIALDESPPRVVTARIPSAGGLEPLTTTIVTNDGLDPTPLGVLLTGIPGGPEHCPVLVNVTTSEAVAVLDPVAPGERLWLTPTTDPPGLRASREGVDVTGRVRRIAPVRQGEPWRMVDVRPEPTSLLLQPGANELWYLPVAHFDASGLDRVLLALAERTLREGRFDATAFDEALFFQDPALIARLWWRETRPAAVRINVPGGALLTPMRIAGNNRRVTTVPDGIARRESLALALDTGVERLAAAGVATEVVVEPLVDVQPLADRLVARLPIVIREGGPTGGVGAPDAGGIYDTTRFDDSTYR